jgi:DNA-binding Xre family transcriptional regulator
MKIKLRNRLEVLMKDSGINTFEEMAQRLTQNQGWKIARTSLSRKFRDEDVSLTLKMVEAICNELQCLPGDLFETEVSEASEEFVAGLRTRLQPFRYGTVRIQKAGSAAAAPGAPDEAKHPGEQAKASPKAKAPIENDEDVGPRVTHLNIGKLNKT